MNDNGLQRYVSTERLKRQGKREVCVCSNKHTHAQGLTHTGQDLCCSMTSTGSPSTEKVVGLKIYLHPKQINAWELGRKGNHTS